MNNHFKALYMSYYKKVYTICYMILNSHEMAEEATQETFIAVYENIHTLKDFSKFPAWINTIARNKAISLYNKNKKIVPINDEWIIDYFEQNHKNQNDASEVLIKEEQIKIVKDAISELPSELRELIVLKYYLELKDQEISDYTGKPMGTVKSSLNKIRKIIAAKLRSYNSTKKGGESIGNAQ